jgi:hypothetical protein
MYSRRPPHTEPRAHQPQVARILADLGAQQHALHGDGGLLAVALAAGLVHTGLQLQTAPHLVALANGPAPSRVAVRATRRWSELTLRRYVAAAALDRVRADCAAAGCGFTAPMRWEAPAIVALVRGVLRPKLEVVLPVAAEASERLAVCPPLPPTAYPQQHKLPPPPPPPPPHSASQTR